MPSVSSWGMPLGNGRHLLVERAEVVVVSVISHRHSSLPTG